MRALSAVIAACLLAGCETSGANLAGAEVCRLGVASAYRNGGVVTLSFFGNAHGLFPGKSFAVVDAYGVASDRALFPPGEKRVASAPNVDVLTYAEVGADGNASGSLQIATTCDQMRGAQ